MTIGEKIKQARKKAGLTQKQLGEKLGISQSAIVQFEHKTSNPNIETISKIADAIGCKVSDLVPLKNSEKVTIWGDTKNEVDSFDGVIAVLIDVYGHVETIKDENTGDLYYLVGTNNRAFKLYPQDIDAIYNSIKGFARPMIDEIKTLRRLVEKPDTSEE